MVHFNKITATYFPNIGIDDFSLRINKGEMVFLVGPSGAGKSTVLKCLYGDVNIQKGVLSLEGSDITKLSIKQIQKLRRKIGIVFQDYRLINERTVFDNISLPLRIEKKSSSQIKLRTNEALYEIGIEHLAKRFPNELSSGEQQRVSICRALVKKPVMILADEPTGNLDPEASIEIVKIFERLSELGITIVMSTHNHSLIQNTKHTIVNLHLGTRVLS
ncbi:MAG: ATP-binding cassette domain-containing protein [Candidatus Marinimicrobia bacterium]|nr:ATP-binding cassette domain-containing protein [Candidatus Neomarinimicrobiota bacterium]